MKRFKTITIILAVLLLPSLLFAAASKFTTAEAVVNDDNTVSIPLIVGNIDGLMAMDIPLKYSEGVTLKEVTFTNTRVEYFDLKLFNINNEKSTVVIGLINQASANTKPLLSRGEGIVANLIFTIDDPSVSSITIEATELTNPNHSLLYIYSDGEGGHSRAVPEFQGITVALGGVGASGTLPTEFAVNQNYPNPFNPSTEIAFSLPASSKVQISIYNLLGQSVRTLVDEQMPAGNHTVTWDGRNSSGGTVASGVYFYRVATQFGAETKKMLMLK